MIWYVVVIDAEDHPMSCPWQIYADEQIANEVAKEHGMMQVVKVRPVDEDNTADASDGRKALLQVVNSCDDWVLVGEEHDGAKVWKNRLTGSTITIDADMESGLAVCCNSPEDKGL